MEKYFIGVDVGTNSTRAGLFNRLGELVDVRVEPISVSNPEPDFYEQSSDEIWRAVCACVSHLCHTHSERRANIVSIGFAATCSLVVLDKKFEPLPVSKTSTAADDDNTMSKSANINNVIMWMDHRAIKQADFINSLGLEHLRTVGGKISPEMDPPKVLWLKQNYNECFKKAAHFISLPDYLVCKATSTSATIRSSCTTTCKWLLRSTIDEKSWDEEFWKKIGLEEIAMEKFERIGKRIVNPFVFMNLGISKEFAAATQLIFEPSYIDGLKVKVGISMIDAHAGGIGALSLTLGSSSVTLDEPIADFDEILVVVGGTSTCFMASSFEPNYIDGVWGPYFDAMVPKMYLSEAGQSASGKLVDHLVQSHPAWSELEKIAARDKLSIYDTLSRILVKLAEEKNLSDMAYLTRTFHVYPDFHGNRSPLADPQMEGQVCGLSFDSSVQNLSVLYLATIQSLAYQSRHIIEKLNNNGIHPKIMTIIGGLAQNRLYVQILCDVCAIPVLIPAAPETCVTFGAAILGASSYKEFSNFSFRQLIESFKPTGSDVFLQPQAETQTFHEHKYRVYKAMIDDQIKYRKLMQF